MVQYLQDFVWDLDTIFQGKNIFSVTHIDLLPKIYTITKI